MAEITRIGLPGGHHKPGQGHLRLSGGHSSISVPCSPWTCTLVPDIVGLAGGKALQWMLAPLAESKTRIKKQGITDNSLFRARAIPRTEHGTPVLGKELPC